MTVQQSLDNEYSEIEKQIHYHTDAMMKPYEGMHPYLHNLKGNATHHELLMKKFKIEIKIYNFKHEVSA